MSKSEIITLPVDSIIKNQTGEVSPNKNLILDTNENDLNINKEKNKSKDKIKYLNVIELENKLAIENFTKFQICTINRASQQKKIGSLPYGTATVMVHKTELFYNVMGGIDYLRNMSM